MDEYRKFIRFKFFTIEKVKGDKSKYLNITDWIAKFKENKGFESIQECNGLKYSIRDPKCKDSKRWYFRITRARENDSAVIIANDDYKDIPLGEGEYLGEDMQFLYDTEHNIAMIQSSIFSLSIMEIQNILNDTFGYDDENEYIIIKPIMSKESLRKYAKRVKAIELSIANRGIIIPQGKSSFANLFKIFSNESTNRLKIDFSTVGERVNENGDLENLFIEKEDIDALADFIEKNEHAITVGRAKVKLSGDKKQEVIELIGGIMNTIISFKIKKKKSLGFEVAIEEMDKEYNRIKHKVYSLIPKVKVRK